MKVRRARTGHSGRALARPLTKALRVDRSWIGTDHRTVNPMLASKTQKARGFCLECYRISTALRSRELTETPVATPPPYAMHDRLSHRDLQTISNVQRV